MRWVFFLSLLFFFFPAFGHEYHFRLLPADYGGDIQQIQFLFQSEDGIIWLGTDQGLFSYDGRRYTYRPRMDQNHVRVTSISESPDGKIWAGYEDGYIQITTFQGHRDVLNVDSLRGTAISGIVFSGQGTTYITTYGKGIWQHDQRGTVQIRFGPLASITHVYDALMDYNGKLWLATDDGIAIYTPLPDPQIRRIGRAQGLRDEIIIRLAEDDHGNVLIGLYDMGIQRYDIRQDTVSHVLSMNPDAGALTQVLKGHVDDIWVATEKSIWISSPFHPPHPIVLPTTLKSRINDALYDQHGNLWLAAGNRLYIANTQIEYIHPSLTGIQSILPMGNHVWFGCESGLYRTSRDGGELQKFLEQEIINVLCLYRDSLDVLWVGTFGQGLYLLDPVSGRMKHFTERDALSNSSILNMDGRGRKVWLATLGGITEMEWTTHPFDGTMKPVNIRDDPDAPSTYVYDVFASSYGRIWFGTDGLGLYYIEAGSMHDFPIQVTGADSLTQSIKRIYSITEDKEQHLWISTSRGIVYCVDMSGRILHQYGSSQGFLNSLVADGFGEILMVREGEIYSVNTASQHYGFDEASGLLSFTPNINATAIDQDGSVWIADNDMALHYLSFSTDHNRNVLMNFESMSSGQWTGEDPLRLRPDSNFIDIRFTGLWYQNPASVQYRYKLEGHDPDWIYTQEGRAVYSQLSPGKYKFVVEGSRSHDFSQSGSLEKEIVVLPPFYQKWWFILSVILLLGGLIFWFVRGRINRISVMHQLEKEKTMLQLHAIQAQVNPHFLFNSFNTLSSIIEEDQKSAVDYVDQLSAFFRGALMHREDELIPLAQEMEIVRNYIYILKKRYGDNIVIDEKIDNLSGWIAPLSIQLLVENAIKHNTVSSEKHLRIGIQIGPEWVTVTNPIQPKFQSLNESTGFGLSSLVARYAYLTPMKIDISREAHQFTVRIPVIYTDKAS